MLALRVTRPVHEQAFHAAVRRLDTSRRDRDRWLTVATRQDADGVRIAIQDPLDSTAYPIPPSFLEALSEAPLGQSPEPLASVGTPSGWGSAVAPRTNCFGTSS